MTTDNRSIKARDLIASVVHNALDAVGDRYGNPGCDHDTGNSPWTGDPYAVQCVQVAQDALTKLAEADIHVEGDL